MTRQTEPPHASVPRVSNRRIGNGTMTEQRRYRPCRSCGSTRVTATACPAADQGRERVVLECAGCAVRRGSYSRKCRTVAPRIRQETRTKKAAHCPCTGCDVHAGRCHQSPNADEETFEGYCEECHAHCFDPDGKIEQELYEDFYGEDCF